jgi:hypothetical protein
MSTLSRRSLLRAGSGFAASATVLGCGVALAGPAAADVPASPYFDITQPSYDLFRNKMLHESHHVMQGFTFDNVNRRLFIAQLQNGSSGDDLCVNQVDFAGNRVASMHVSGAGHGVSIGVEAVGGASYIWMECDSDRTDDTGRGTALARFEFVDGATPTLRKFLPGSKTITCATDPVHGRIVVRRNEGGTMRYSLHDLPDAAAGDFDAPLTTFTEPALGGVFQGYTIHGQYLYTLDGTGHDDPADIDSYVTRIDMNTGAIEARALTRAGSTLVYREPEGMAVYRTEAGETRLFLGFGSRDGADRYANIFYKNALV